MARTAERRAELGLDLNLDGKDARGDGATVRRYLAQGYADISPEGDFGVLKKIIKESANDDDAYPGGASYALEGCPTTIHYIGRLADGTGSIYDTTREVVDGKNVGGTDDPFTFNVGREKAILGFDAAVGSMHKGEVASFLFLSEYAYGTKGCPPKVVPGAALEVEIELISWKAPLPRFPSQQEIAESRRKRREKDLADYKANPPPSNDEKIEAANKEREAGNVLYAQKEYEKAKEKYDAGFVNIFIGKEEWSRVTSDQDKAKINACKKLLHLNRGMVKLKLERYHDALWDCDKALEIDPCNVKGLYRRCLVYTAKLNNELQKEKDGKFWVCEKAWELHDNAKSDICKAIEEQLKEKEDGADADKSLLRAQNALRRSCAVLKKYTARYKDQQKTLYRDKIMVPLEKQNQAKRIKELKNAQEKIYEDMPELEDDEDEADSAR